MQLFSQVYPDEWDQALLLLWPFSSIFRTKSTSDFMKLIISIFKTVFSSDFQFWKKCNFFNFFSGWRKKLWKRTIDFSWKTRQCVPLKVLKREICREDFTRLFFFRKHSWENLKSHQQYSPPHRWQLIRQHNSISGARTVLLRRLLSHTSLPKIHWTVENPTTSRLQESLGICVVSSLLPSCVPPRADKRTRL